MIIGIDYRFAITSIRGIGYYIKSVVAELMIIDKVNEYYLYVDEAIIIDLPKNFNLIVINCKNLILFEQVLLPRRAKKDRVEVLWYPSNSGPFFLHKNIKLIVTVHDIISLNSRISFKSLSNIKRIKFAFGEKYRGWALAFGISRIADLITVSDYSAFQIFKLLGVKATVIYNQIYPSQVLENSMEFLKRFEIETKNYIYTIAGTAPHKNLEAYIELFKNGQIKLPIVISGVVDLQVIKQYQSKWIIFSGFVSEKEKSTLYANAKAFLFLSLEEGFGLPIIEAMQFQIPIISANRGALPEVVGNAGILIDPNDLKKIEEELLALDDASFEELKTKQKLQFAKFNNWKSAAKAHLDLFNSHAK